MSLTKIGSIGINTGIQFAGVTTVSTLHVGSGVTLSSDGDVFATGISTFSEDIKVGSGVTISPDGDGFYTGVVTATTFSGALAASNLTGALPAISGANLTNLDASDLASGTVPTARLGSGTASSSTFLRGDSTFATITTTTINSNTNNYLITGTGTADTLQGESTLTYDGTNLDLPDDKKIRLGTGNDLHIYHQSSNNTSYIQNTSDTDLSIINDGTNIYIKSSNGEKRANFIKDGAVELYYDNSKKFETTNSGGTLYGDWLADANFLLSDGDKIKLGASADLQIYHSSDVSYIDDLVGAGDGIAVRAKNIRLQSNANIGAKSALNCIANGAVELFHNDTKQCETSSNGLAFPSGKGIDFSATSDASGASNELLDDYEEGTWTPTLGSGTATAYLNQWYTKIGQVVTCYVYLYNFSDNSSSTHFNISGLPFAYKTNHEATVQFMSNGNASLPSNCMGIWGRIGVTGNSDQIAVYTHFNTTGGGTFLHSNLGSSHLMAVFSYVTAS